MSSLLSPFVNKIKFDQETRNQIAEHVSDKPFVLVVRKKSKLSFVTLKNRLAKENPSLTFYCSYYTPFSELSTCLKKGSLILLFVNDNSGNSELFNREIALVKNALDIKLSCVFILWKKRTRYNNDFSQFDYPKGFYKFILTLIKPHKAQLIFTHFFSLSDIPTLETYSAFFLYKIEAERLSILGPQRASRKELINKILMDASFINKLKSESKKPKDYLKAKRYLYEIASNKRASAVAKISKILTYVWRFTLEGIYVDLKGLEKVREVSRSHQIVYVPSHRSHADYLMIGDILYRYNMDSPITAAGINMAFFPFSTWFRRAGAFFLRRTFKGNPVYASVFNRYLEEIVKEGSSQMFYIEGGRSRTGKLLSPKFGMLSMMIDIMRRGAVSDFHFVPVSVEYGKLFEGQSYIEELSGKDKKKESVFAIFDTFKYFKRRQGITYIQFGEPFSIYEYFNQKNLHLSELTTDTYPIEIEKLGYHVIDQINTVVTVTPSAIISLVLLSNAKRGIRRLELLRSCKMIYNYLKSKNVRLASISENFEHNFNSVLNNFQYNKYVTIIPFESDSVIKLDENYRPYLDYYKNNIIHLFLPLAFISSAILRAEEDDVKFDKVLEDVVFLKEIFHYEFVFTEIIWNDAGMYETLKFLSLVKEIKLHDQTISKVYKKNNWLTINRNVIANFVESYFLVLDFLLQNKNLGTEKEILKALLPFGDRFYDVGVINRTESVSSENFKNCLRLLRKKQFIAIDDKKVISVINKDEIQKLRTALFLFLN